MIAVITDEPSATTRSAGSPRALSRCDALAGRSRTPVGERIRVYGAQLLLDWISQAKRQAMVQAGEGAALGGAN